MVHAALIGHGCMGALPAGSAVYGGLPAGSDLYGGLPAGSDLYGAPGSDLYGTPGSDLCGGVLVTTPSAPNRSQAGLDSLGVRRTH